VQRGEAPLRFFIFPQERGIKGVEGNNKDNTDGSRGDTRGWAQPTLRLTKGRTTTFEPAFSPATVT
jgi:hypothetical protein